MNSRLPLLGAWSGAAFCLCFAVGLGVFAHWIPPPAPSMSAGEVATLFREATGPIRIGMVFMALGTIFFVPYTVMISDLIHQVEGRSYFLSGTQITGGLLSLIVLFIPVFDWVAASFRPERDPEITQAMVDHGWLIFITGLGPFVLQNVAIAVAILHDRRTVPAFPRWVAYLQIWVSLIYLPGLAAYFMKSGPFAWNGLFVWWIPLGAFAAWFVALIHSARGAILGRPVGSHG